MKIKFIAALIAAMAAQSAFALSGTATYAIQTGSDTNGVAVYMAGASATKAGIYAANGAASALSYLCNTNSLTAFTSSDSNISAYSCTIKSASDLAGVGVTTDVAADFITRFAGKNLLLALNVTNGSFTAIQSMSPTATDRNKQMVFAADGTSTTFSTAYQADGGFMDVNPEMFADQVLTLSFTPSYDVVTVGAGQAFGVVVSQALYADLQTVQGLTGCTAANVTAACQPNITKSQYASLINSVNAGNANWGVLGLTTDTSVQAVRICRRPATSGTQASSDAFFLGSRCIAGSATPSYATDSSDTYIVTEGSTTGAAKTCLGSTTNYAIGVISAENTNTLAADSKSVTNTWRYVKLDGVAISDPTVNGSTGVITNGYQRATALAQSYDYNFEFVAVKRTGSTKASLLDGLAAVLSNQTIVRTLPGLFVSPLSGTTYSADADTSNRVVSKTTRYSNACLPNAYVF